MKHGGKVEETLNHETLHETLNITQQHSIMQTRPFQVALWKRSNSGFSSLAMRNTQLSVSSLERQVPSCVTSLLSKQGYAWFHTLRSRVTLGYAWVVHGCSLWPILVIPCLHQMLWWISPPAAAWSKPNPQPHGPSGFPAAWKPFAPAVDRPSWLAAFSIDREPGGDHGEQGWYMLSQIENKMADNGWWFHAYSCG